MSLIIASNLFFLIFAKASPVANRGTERFAEAFWFWRTSVSVRSNRYLWGSWLADRLMAVLWAYLVVRGFGRRRGSARR
jgi:hypothetical protein